jgi:cytochrome P450
MSETELPQLHLLAPETVECPFARYQELMSAGGVGVDPVLNATLVAGRERVMRLALEPTTLSSRRLGELARRMGSGTGPVSPDAEELLARAHEERPALFTADPPEHTRHRRLVNSAFTPARIRTLEPKIRALAEEHLAALPADADVDFLDEFAAPFPLAVIGDLLGIDRAFMRTIKEWAEHIMAGMSQLLTHEQQVRTAETILEFQEYFIPELERRRQHPTDDFLSDLVNARTIDGDTLSTPELLPMVVQFTTAGHATTTHFIANAVLALIERPDLADALRDDPASTEPFLEEILRISPPVLGSFRWTTRETELEGTALEPRELVILLWGSAGWDPSVFPEPQELRLDRPNGRSHMAFGHGIHFCVGAPLARLEARIAIETLLREFDRIELVPEQSDLTHIQSFAVNACRRIVLRMSRASRGATPPARPL